MVVVAVDLDDVLAQTNAKVAELHNAEFGTDMTLEDFKYYHYWRNRGWGTPLETMIKVKSFYQRHLFADTAPVEGAFESLVRAKETIPGLEFVIVTARGEPERVGSQIWVDKFYPGVFRELYFTGAFTHVATEGENGPPLTAVSHPLKKSEVLHRIGASILIDDSIENAFDVANSNKPKPKTNNTPSSSPEKIPVLLFSIGHYPWNQRLSTPGPEDRISYDEAQKLGLGDDVGLVLDKDLPEGVTRVNGWKEVEGVLAKLFGGKSE
ncbi:hypothetical protein BDY24DRAFT_401306 [Mrakia frigida]|uniref:uncharacterized protein n=1 Tax=Mrakia frigida TaxID=29902 RepID=UPI003FCC15FA